MDMDVMHAMGVSQRMDRELPQPPFKFVVPVFPVQTAFDAVFLEYLAHTVGGDVCGPVIAGFKKKIIRFMDFLVSLGHLILVPEQGFYIVHELLRDMAGPGMLGLGVLGRDVDRCIDKIQMFQLYSHEFSYPAS